MDRWTKILESKPIPLLEHLIEEMAKILAADFESWPPPIEELDPISGQAFQPLFQPAYPRPARAVYREAFAIAKLELRREVEAVSDYLRNKRYVEAGLSEADKLAMLFLCRWLTEQLLSLSEATEGRLKRTHLVDLLERVERRALGPLVYN